MEDAAMKFLKRDISPRAARWASITCGALVVVMLFALSTQLSLNWKFAPLKRAMNAVTAGDAESVAPFVIGDTHLPVAVRVHLARVLTAQAWSQKVLMTESKHGGRTHPDAALKRVYGYAAANGDTLSLTYLFNEATQKGEWVAGTPAATLAIFRQDAYGGDKLGAALLGSIYSVPRLAAVFDVKADEKEAGMWK